MNTEETKETPIIDNFCAKTWQEVADNVCVREMKFNPWIRTTSKVAREILAHNYFIGYTGNRKKYLEIQSLGMGVYKVRINEDLKESLLTKVKI